MTPRSPNEGRELAKLVRDVPLAVGPKALLRELVASYHAASGGASPGRLSLALWTGLDDSALGYARAELEHAGLIYVERRPPENGRPQTSLTRFNRAALAAAAEQGRAQLAEKRKARGNGEGNG